MTCIVRNKTTGMYIAKRIVATDPRHKFTANPLQAYRFVEDYEAARYVAAETYGQLPAWKRYSKDLSDYSLGARKLLPAKPPKETTNVLKDYEMIRVFTITAYDFDGAKDILETY